MFEACTVGSLKVSNVSSPEKPVYYKPKSFIRPEETKLKVEKST